MREAWQHDRRSRHARGYGSEWDKKRKRILKRDGYRCVCAECKRTLMLKAATEVDHIVSKANWLRKHGTLDGVDDDSNLQSINSDCHKAKSLLERGFKPSVLGVRIGEDGYPVDPTGESDRGGVAKF